MVVSESLNTMIERRTAYARDRGRNANTRQARATRERITAYARDTIRNNN